MVATLLLISALLWIEAPDQRQETAHVVVTPVAVKGPVEAGKPVELRLDVEPRPKMHVYAPEQKDYIPVSLTIEKGAGYTAKPAVFPPPEKYFFKALDETQLVYSKKFQITVPVTVTAAASGPMVVKGTLEYQACDESVCYRPVKVPVEWTLTR